MRNMASILVIFGSNWDGFFTLVLNYVSVKEEATFFMINDKTSN